MASDRASHTATTLLDGRVLIVGGYGDGRTGMAEVFDPATDTFQPAGELQPTRQGRPAQGWRAV